VYLRDVYLYVSGILKLKALVPRVGVYFPRMGRDEELMLKCWDSGGRDFAQEHEHAQPVRARSTFCFHSAFEDESDPGPDRESIEVRALRGHHPATALRSDCGCP
jgi:hypothetical protein